MINISANNIITLIRGDTATFKLNLNIGTKWCPKYPDLSSYDKIYFGIAEPKQIFEHSIVKKCLTAADIIWDENLQSYTQVTVQLKAEDTENLLPGTYYYELKWVKQIVEQISEQVSTISEQVYTIIPKTKFIILD